MGSLVDDIVEKVGDLVEDKGSGWLDRGISNADRLLADAIGHAEPTSLEFEMLQEAGEGLKWAQENREMLASYGKARAAGILIRLSAGDTLGARRLALASTSTFAERRAASTASTAATHSQAEAREKAHDAMVEKAKEVGWAALKAALPFILAAL